MHNYKYLAAVLEGRNKQQKLAQIATDCQVSDRTIRDWIAHPDFQAKLTAMRDSVLDACDELGVAYARKVERVAALGMMAESARSYYEQYPILREFRPVLVKRQQEPTEDEKADGKSGRMQTVEDYIITERFNEAAHAAMRASFADIAAELGQRKNVTELTGKNGEALPGLVISVVPATGESKSRYRRQGARQAVDEEVAEASESNGSSSG